MKSGYFMMSMPVAQLFSVLKRNHLSFRPIYAKRLVMLLQAALGSSILAAREQVLFAKKLSRQKLPRDPIFIIGHWRSGTTLLHQLLACDPDLWAPTLFQCCYPHSFLSSRPFVEPIMRAMLTATRPMDNVRLGLDEPQEEENALFRMTGFSPLERLIFPSSGDYFLSGDHSFLPHEPEQRRRWLQAFGFFSAKLTFATGKRLVFKNPFNSLRIPQLSELFPEARFIHMTRDPFAVIPSTHRMWSITGRENAMNATRHNPVIEQVAEGYVRLENALAHSLRDIKPERHCQISFEELEADPVRELMRVYRLFGWPFSDALKHHIQRKIQSFGDYRKNSYSLNDSQRATIASSLRGYPVLRG